MTYFIEWKSEYETGNVMVDREHHDLIDLANLLLSADANIDGGLGVKEAYDALWRYMDTHFKHEEDLLEAVNSSHLSSQKTNHDMLREELHNLWSGESENTAKETMRGLAQWCENRLLRHFLVNDAFALHSFPFNDEAEHEEVESVH